MPLMKAVGRKTAISVKVVAITARPISSAASSAACKGVLPMRRWRMMFSISTIASSTRMPTTSDIDSSVTTLSVKPIRYMAAKVGMIDSGNAVAETKVARQSRRKSQTTTTARMAPSISSAIEPFEVFLHRIDEIEGLGDRDVRVVLLQLFQHGAHAVGDIDLAGAAAADDLEADHRLAVEQGGRALLGDGVADCRQPVEAHQTAVAEGNFHLSQFLG